MKPYTRRHAYHSLPSLRRTRTCCTPSFTSALSTWRCSDFIHTCIYTIQARLLLMFWQIISRLWMDTCLIALLPHLCFEEERTFEV